MNPTLNCGIAMPAKTYRNPRYLAYRLECPGHRCTNQPVGDVASPLSDVKVFRPGLSCLFLRGERPSMKGVLVRFCFTVMARGRLRIFYLRSPDGRLAHTSCVVPKCFKFPFLVDGDFEIGPCLTYPDFRKQGLYVKVLRHIIRIVGEEEGRRARCWMFVKENNTASIKGIERAGLSRVGTVETSRWFKIYRLRRDNTDE